MAPLTYGSLFSGVGGFDLGFDRAGMVCAWQCEIDAAARSVLTRHWPDVPKHEDVRGIGGHNLEPVDVVCGGFPCQDLSVAGNRAGLAGERSGLWHEFHRILGELRPRWCVIENVPGLLSSNGGRDFAVILRGLVQLGYGVSYRILDAQHFGVAQRRRRVFIVGSLGNGRSAQVLFESEGMRGHPPTRRAQGQDIAGTLGGGAGQRGWSPDTDRMTFVPVSVVPILETGARTGASTTDPRAGIGIGQDGDPMFTLQAGKQHAVSVALRGRDGGATAELGGEVATALRASQGGGDKPHVLVATFDERNVTSKTNRTRVEYGAPANTLHADGLSVITSQAFQQNTRDEVRYIGGDGQIAGALAASAGMKQQNYVQQPMAVRRLTPTESERLQGFPDGHTAGQSDSQRYRQLGNAVCVPVAEWIARRIVEATA